MKSKTEAVRLFNANEVRAHFMRQGTYYSAWAVKQQFKFRLVSQIINGRNNGSGRVGRKIVAALRKELKRK